MTVGDSGKGLSRESCSEDRLLYPPALPVNKVRAHEFGLVLDEDDALGMFNVSDFAWGKCGIGEG